MFGYIYRHIIAFYILMYKKSSLHSLLRINTTHAKMDVMPFCFYIKIFSRKKASQISYQQGISTNIIFSPFKHFQRRHFLTLSLNLNMILSLEWLGNLCLSCFLFREVDNGSFYMHLPSSSHIIGSSQQRSTKLDVHIIFYSLDVKRLDLSWSFLDYIDLLKNKSSVSR